MKRNVIQRFTINKLKGNKVSRQQSIHILGGYGDPEIELPEVVILCTPPPRHGYCWEHRPIGEAGCDWTGKTVDFCDDD